jgi:ribosomal protein L14E/L6E/L27E
MTNRKELVPGAIVRSRRGRDEGELAVVIALEGERYAYIADGNKRRFDRPKRKNLLHLEPVGIVSEEVANSLRETGRVTNGKLRFAVADARRRLEAKVSGTHAEEKGE